MDWLDPTTDFHTRSEVSTAIAISILLAAGFWTAWRSGSFYAGAAAGFAITATAAVLSVGATALLLAFWHDARTMTAIQASGGLEEAFQLPAILILPGLALGAIAGVVGAGVKRFSRAA